MRWLVPLAFATLALNGTASGMTLPPFEVVSNAVSPEAQALLNQTSPGVFIFDHPRREPGLDSRQLLAQLEARAQTQATRTNVLILNAGLEDLRRDSKSGANHVPLDEYAKNLHAIIVEARKTSLDVIWCNISLVENAGPQPVYSDAADVDSYNAAAAKVMAEENVIVADIHGFYKSLQTKPPLPPFVFGPKIWKQEAEYYREAAGQWWAVCARTNPAVKRFPLWSGTPPMYQASGDEILNDRGRIQNVTVPELTVFAPPVKCCGTAIIVFPGGGYAFVGFLRNAQELADILRPRGIVVFGLKYRTGRGPGVALPDAERAVRWVRSHAAEYGIDPHRIGIAGTSAGANLALNLATRFTPGDANAPDPLERLSSRPDFVAVFSSWNYGKLDSPFTFHDGVPPIFLRHAEDDKGFPLAQKIVAQIQAANVPLNYRFIGKGLGGHGAFDFAPGEGGTNWPDELVPWITQLGLLAPHPDEAAQTSH